MPGEGRSEKVGEKRRRQFPAVRVVGSRLAVSDQYATVLDECTHRERFGLGDRARARQDQDTVTALYQLSALDLLSRHKSILTAEVFEETTVRFAQPSHGAVFIGTGRSFSPGLSFR